MNQLFLDLCKVKALLIDGWAQGKTVFEPGRTCLYRAVTSVEPYQQLPRPPVRHRPARMRSPLYNAIYDELNSIGWFNGMIEFNDAPGRTKQEVIDLVQRAANRAGGADA
jgi:hypothetical protein